MLAPAFPDRTFEQLAALSVGERNVRLVALRVRLFGSAVEAVVACPRCGVALEFAFDLLDVCSAARDPDAFQPAPFEVALDDRRLLCRPATTSDLAALPSGEGSAARRELAARLVVEGWGGEAKLTPSDVDEAAAARIAAALEDADPYAQTPMAFTCAACEHEWTSSYDIVSYLWTEIVAQVHRILEDVQRLAKSYGWAEGSILAMSGVRRRFYLDRAV